MRFKELIWVFTWKYQMFAKTEALLGEAPCIPKAKAFFLKPVWKRFNRRQKKHRSFREGKLRQEDIMDHASCIKFRVLKCPTCFQWCLNYFHNLWRGSPWWGPFSRGAGGRGAGWHSYSSILITGSLALLHTAIIWLCPPSGVLCSRRFCLWWVAIDFPRLPLIFQALLK